MNIDDLVNSIPDEDFELRNNLGKWVEDWKRSEDSINQLDRMVSKWHGNVWFKSEEEQNKFYANWQTFKSDAIHALGGLTVNERLYWFGLFDQWDQSDDKGKNQIRRKLKAKA